MNPWYLRTHVYPKIAPWVATALVIGIGVERAISFADTSSSLPGKDALAQRKARPEGGTTEKSRTADLPKPSPDRGDDEEANAEGEPLGEGFLHKYPHIKTRADACKEFEGKIITYYDQPALVRDCKQRLIEDPEFLNELIQKDGKLIREVPRHVYRLIPHGLPYGRQDTPNFRNKKLTSEECSLVDKKYITVSGLKYYYVENCKRRAFQDFYALQAHNANKDPIKTVTPEFLYKIPEGKEMRISGQDEDKILYQIDGDVEWSKLGNHREGPPQPDTPERLAKVAEGTKNPVNRATLCKKINRKVVSFYSQVFFVEECSRRPLGELSLDLQVALQSAGGIVDLTPEQYAVLSPGKKISNKEVLKKLR